MPERTKPLKFAVESFSLYATVDGKRLWVAEATWDEEDGCFCLDGEGPGNWDYAPCDLEELARVLRAIPRNPGGK